jgi:hypothetical protein
MVVVLVIALVITEVRIEYPAVTNFPSCWITAANASLSEKPSADLTLPPVPKFVSSVPGAGIVVNDHE